ncbi:CLUMA_CG002807, isoform A [Clunio marinus]|uniref:CLUMA_CG002807, isoform A n=1 Tax=Clunio marinus TaxID=568069 RepID=A0A1J1HLB9_9DIPT|nr:CLUMA_CG002807, isoform A [Clunio marinus]
MKFYYVFLTVIANKKSEIGFIEKMTEISTLLSFQIIFNYQKLIIQTPSPEYNYLKYQPTHTTT